MESTSHLRKNKIYVVRNITAEVIIFSNKFKLYNLTATYSTHSFKYNQQHATLYNILYYCQCCTSFGRFLRPSSGAQELYTQHLVRASLAATCTALTVIKNIV
jgi:hypothetical protein